MWLHAGTDAGASPIGEHLVLATSWMWSTRCWHLVLSFPPTRAALPSRVWAWLRSRMGLGGGKALLLTTSLQGSVQPCHRSAQGAWPGAEPSAPCLSWLRLVLACPCPGGVCCGASSVLCASREAFPCWGSLRRAFRNNLNFL